MVVASRRSSFHDGRCGDDGHAGVSRRLRGPFARMEFPRRLFPRAGLGERGMKQCLLPSFVAQRERFSLRFTCEHCTYFDEPRERCVHGYPNQEHRAAYYAAGPSVLAFCKEFELK